MTKPHDTNFLVGSKGQEEWGAIIGKSGNWPGNSTGLWNDIPDWSVNDGEPFYGIVELEGAVIPAPSALVGLISMGLMGALGYFWRRRKRAA